MRVCIILLLTLVAILVASWFTIDWTDEGAESFPGGAVLIDDAGQTLRVSLGPKDVDCRPSYTADPEDWIVKALIAVEDDSFWRHHGVRPLSILRASFQNVFYGRRISGASTITMQAVRLIKPHPKTFWWKWKEAIMALKMEREKSKIWILSQYLNRAPYGSNLVGIESASQGWFGKSTKELGIAEAAMLAGMVQAPSRLRPDRGYEKAVKRRLYVLTRMRDVGFITEDQFEGATNVTSVVCRSPRPFAAPYFCDWYMAANREKTKRGGVFKTALKADIQELCESVVARAEAEGGYSSAAVVVRVSTGDVVAMACSGDYFNSKDGQVNTAVAPRPAGSTLKPFLTALAFDRGDLTPETPLSDTPMAVKGYRPTNFDADYRGNVSVRDALILSLNVPFVRLLRTIGVVPFCDTLRALGFEHLGNDDTKHGLGLAIGSAEVTLVELTRAYAVLARGGDRVFSRASSYLISDMLSGSERASAALGHVADVAAPRFAWKTGTSSAYRDAWTVLWNPEYAIGVWCGHKRGGFGDRSLVGARAAAPHAWQIARMLYPANNSPWFVEPADIGRRTICTLSGAVATADCPETTEGRFINGVTSSAICTRHRRDAEGKSMTIEDRESLRISQPQDGASFEHVAAQGVTQRIVCRAIGVDKDARLWWFSDDQLLGCEAAERPFAVEMVKGEHVISCSTEEGETASVRINVL